MKNIADRAIDAVGKARPPGRDGVVLPAGRVVVGDELFDGAGFVPVVAVRRAQGRKPAVGENLHIVVEGDGVARVNSEAPVWIRGDDRHRVR